MRAEFDIGEARRLRAEGRAWAEIARRLGMTNWAIRRAVEPEYAARQAANHRAARRRLKNMQGRAISPSQIIGHGSRGSAVAADAERQLARRPPDTRNRAAILMGDPRPGESALDRKRAKMPA